jgi:hypothetical protein
MSSPGLFFPTLAMKHRCSPLPQKIKKALHRITMSAFALSKAAAPSCGEMSNGYANNLVTKTSQFPNFVFSVSFYCLPYSHALLKSSACVAEAPKI